MEFTIGLLIGIVIWRLYTTWFLREMIKEGNIEIKKSNKYIKSVLKYW